ncbi:MAG: type IV toxin-antitoxin system AbiEi family antitoxin domain-containing protein [Melioribacteraceae bacterium]|nr:type IV toxin-antitoxin system AbiEi family antitoxin domain-containing protein [Melioribacteraceae bacterium]
MVSQSLHTFVLPIMEMLYLVPQRESFDEAYLIMEGLSTLRPKLVTDLLISTSSIKVKRLFMWMAEKANHQWVEDLNLSEVDFGSGKRMIVKNGKLDKKYKITVPREFEDILKNFTFPK